MYQFTDPNSAPVGQKLPAEAMSINGIYIEHQLDGYQTMCVEGRELLDTEINDYIVGNMNGSRLKSTRRPPRIITVTYLLQAKNPEEFREKFNKLNQLLDFKEAHVSFRDEENKYYIGTISSVSGTPEGSDIQMGTFTIHCCDPLKYTFLERKAEAQNGKISFVNQGSQPSHPTFEARMKSDNGYLAFVNQDGNILQFGDPGEIDGETYQKSELLINDAMSSAVQGWRLNDATVVKVVSEHRQTGTFGQGVLHGEDYITPSNYGDGQQWHGPSYAKKIPVDSNGKTGARNCTMEWQHYLTTDFISDMGVCQFHMTDKNGANIAAITYFKQNPSNNSGMYHLYINGKVVYEGAMEFPYWNPLTSWELGRSSIQKFGGEFTFRIANSVVHTFRNTSLANTEVAEISFYLGGWNTVKIGTNLVRRVKFTSHSVEYWRNIPNKFSSGDILRIEGESGNVYVNNVLVPELGVLGNNWEEFLIQPGQNEIRCMYSDFAKPPEITLSYKEAYL